LAEFYVTRLGLDRFRHHPWWHIGCAFAVAHWLCTSHGLNSLGAGGALMHPLILGRASRWYAPYPPAPFPRFRGKGELRRLNRNSPFPPKSGERVGDRGPPPTGNPHEIGQESRGCLRAGPSPPAMRAPSDSTRYSRGSKNDLFGASYWKYMAFCRRQRSAPKRFAKRDQKFKLLMPHFFCLLWLWNHTMHSLGN
jgi:hypothetical protein